MASSHKAPHRVREEGFGAVCQDIRIQASLPRCKQLQWNNLAIKDTLNKGHHLQSQPHRVVYKSTSELGAPLHTGQPDGSQCCLLLRFHCSWMLDCTAGPTFHSLSYTQAQSSYWAAIRHCYGQTLAEPQGILPLHAHSYHY